MTTIVITQCCMRHLYNANPPVPHLVEQAKAYERRRCNHHELEQPLSAFECLSEVVDSKGSKTNKHKYVIASQDSDVRAHMREIPGVPLIYIKRSVMIMEPMASATQDFREREERGKFKAGLKGSRGAATLGKRKREEMENGLSEANVGELTGEPSERGQATVIVDEVAPKKRKRNGLKTPNPLSVKKPKRRPVQEAPVRTKTDGVLSRDYEGPAEDVSGDAAKSKRKRKHKSESNGQTHSRLDAITDGP